MQRFATLYSIGLTLSLTFFGIALTGCGNGDAPPTASIANDGGSGTSATPTSANPDQPIQLVPENTTTISPVQSFTEPHPVVVIKTSKGNIKVKLDAEKAPRTVENFIETYARRGFYTDTIVHYVAKDFMIAGGGYGTDQTLKQPMTEIRNECDNGLLNKRGTIAMMRHPEYADSATSQFFINLADNTNLDNQPSDDGTVTGYCVFGEVVEGMDVVDAIAQLPVSDANPNLPSTPVEQVVIQAVEVVK